MCALKHRQNTSMKLTCFDDGVLDVIIEKMQLLPHTRITFSVLRALTLAGVRHVRPPSCAVAYDTNRASGRKCESFVTCYVDFSSKCRVVGTNTRSTEGWYRRTEHHCKQNTSLYIYWGNNIIMKH